jgi:hypothetical protein
VVTNDLFPHAGAIETFRSALDDDLDTPIALLAMEEFAEQIPARGFSRT